MPPTITPQELVAKWRGETRKERSVSQEHFIDLCRLLGHQTPGENRDGTLSFEEGASKSSGGNGWADVWKKGHFAWEYKGPHADLDKAYKQIQQYRESLQNPPLLVVSDIQQIVIHTNFTNTVKKVYTLTLNELLTTAGMTQLRNIFEQPEAFRAPLTTEDVTREAAQEFAKLASQLRRYGEEPHRIAHFLIQLLFCLFAEDIGLLPNGLFTRLISSTRKRAPLFAEQLRQLFAAMANGGFFSMEDIPHFNGRLFDNADVLELDSNGLDTLARASRLDWSSIEPSILGTLFERSVDPAKRSQLGMHYTGRDDILLIVEPVLMAPLRRRWEVVQQQARDLAARRDAAAGATQRNRLQGELQGLLRNFAQEIAGIRVLDPACGSGNFLYVALKQLLDLEKAVILFAGDIGAGAFFPQVGPEQLRGIEVNDYAHELAQITVWIGYIQWLRDNGFGQPSQPILKPLDTIQHIDAILAFDEQGRPIEPAWPEADVIIGNPPFLGGNKIRKELGDQTVDVLFKLYEGRVPAFADLVCYWFERARALIETGQTKRAGLLATQGIRGGANRKVLERIKQTGDIFWAQSDRNWILDGATVHVSMVGFDNGKETERSLNGQLTASINSNLTSLLNLTLAQKLSDNKDICFYGSQQKGSFDITEAQAKAFLDKKNSFNRDMSDVVKRAFNGKQLLQRNNDAWVIDFGVDMPLEEASLYEAPFEYVKQRVLPERKERSEKRQREYWWLHARPSPRYRAILSKQTRYIATPSLSKHRVFVWLDSSILADHQIIVFARDDDYFFGVLHSKIHELWARGTGTQLREVESGFRYTPSTTFETFAFPWPPGQEPADDPRVAAIGMAARDLVEKRDRWLNPEGADAAELKTRTLTNLYNTRPTWLDLAQKQLDAAVLDAYGWPQDIADEEILTRLLTLNLERAAKQGGAAPTSVGDETDE